MKIIYFADYYPDYLKYFTASNPLISGPATYEEKLKLLQQDYFGSFGSYASYASLSGHEAHLIVANFEPLQKTWAKENSFNYSENNWAEEIALAQIQQIKPDVFFIGSMFNYYDSFLDKVKPHARKIFGWIACPIPEGIKLNKLEMILTSVPELVTQFKGLGIHSELLSAAFDPNVLGRLKQKTREEKDIAFSFIGGVSNSQHSKRKELLNYLAQKTPIEIYGYGIEAPPVSLKGKIKTYVTGNYIRTRYKGPVFGMDMFSVLHRSKITFNAHINMALGNRVNMRMFEATGAGTLLLTDKAEEGNLEYFEDGKEIVTYSGPEEALEKVNYYLSHEQERARIAAAGQKRTLSGYTYNESTSKMISFFQNRF